MWQVTVNNHSCEGKRDCLEVCPTDVFGMQKARVRHPLFWIKAKVHGGSQAVPVREEDCIGCTACARACPELAITAEAVEQGEIAT